MDAFLGEIRIFAGYYAPYGWAFCNGQLLPISQNTALFSLLGTVYGGDGKSTFALPNLQGRAPLCAGQGPGLTNRALGAMGGAAEVTLTEQELPPHTHVPMAVVSAGTQASPSGAVWAGGGRGRPPTFASAANVNMHPGALAAAGGGQPHENMPPYLTLNFIIALWGIFPQRP